MRVVVLTGPPGAGKSSVATALHDSLGEAGVTNALIEVDELERCYPALDADRVFLHVATLCASFREAGYGLLLLTATIEEDAYGQRLLQAAGASERLIVCLMAEPSSLEARVRARDPAGWSGLDAQISASQRLSVTMVALRGIDLVVSTEDQRVEDVAARIERVLRERGYA